MIARHAKDVVRRWVTEQATQTPGFQGAFFHGSINWLADDAPLPATSDVDVMVALEGANPPNKLGKFIFQGVMLEVSYLPSDQLDSPDQVLGVSHLAGSFQTSSIIMDPSGRLTRLQEVVAKEYAKRFWIHKRCEHARQKVLNNLQGLNESAPFHDQVTSWLFAAGVTTHILLAAGLKNPTVRRRYVAVRDLLADYGHSDFYNTLLELLGCEQMTPARVERHLASLTDAFDAARAVIRTPFFFAADISDIARPVAIDGSRDMVERGDHREALFWIVATLSRCQKVLYHDAPVEMQNRFSPGYRQLLADLGITSFSDLQQRSEQVKGHLPRIWEVAEAIMAANREIID